jgi:hypothetical protein
MAHCYIIRQQLKITQRRDWLHYSKEKLNEKLIEVDWNNDCNTVQEAWNDLENKLVKIVDSLVPISEFKGNHLALKPCPIIKRKLNLRNRLLKLLKNRPTLDLRSRIKNLNFEICSHFRSIKRNNVRRCIIPGNSKSLWDAVKMSMDSVINPLPDLLTLGGVPVGGHERSGCFATFFSEKVSSITNSTLVDPLVYNGEKKLAAGNLMFMSTNEVQKSIESIKLKNTEGYDRIPQRVLVDGIEHLLQPFTKLFDLIYREKSIPEQWRISKIVPVHKKGSKQMIENYRPVANLCSASKVFERLILNRINQLETLANIDLTGKGQHGFKKNRGTASAGLLLQSLISRALDDDEFVLLASLDLSSAFDVVDVRLLIKRMRIMGLPDDLIILVETWLKKRFFYVEVDNVTSQLLVTWFGIIQGSILGPTLYAIFISPLFDIENLTFYADDGFGLVRSRDRQVLAKLMESKLEKTVEWLKKSGMKVNEAKTDLCLFHNQDTTSVVIKFNGVSIVSSKMINVLGVIFDQKLQWSDHIAHCITKSSKALTAIRLIKNNFTTKELLQLITSNFYSILYYNSEIWHLQSLKQNLKQKLLSASAKAIKTCIKYCTDDVSFVKIHEMCSRSLPENFLLYRHALLLHKLINSNSHTCEWVHLNFNLILTSRQTTFMSRKNNNKRIGLNAFANRVYILNGRIPLDWLNMSKNTFKVHCKKEFLT